MDDDCLLLGMGGGQWQQVRECFSHLDTHVAGLLGCHLSKDFGMSAAAEEGPQDSESQEGPYGNAFLLAATLLVQP